MLIYFLFFIKSCSKHAKSRGRTISNDLHLCFQHYSNSQSLLC